MSSEMAEMQSEEQEALVSIYEGDDNFKQTAPKVFQYKVGNFYFCFPEDLIHSFLSAVRLRERAQVLPAGGQLGRQLSCRVANLQHGHVLQCAFVSESFPYHISELIPVPSLSECPA